MKTIRYNVFETNSMKHMIPVKIKLLHSVISDMMAKESL